MRLSINLQPKPSQQLKQTQCVMLTETVQQAIALLQLPITELNTFLEREITQNPLLEQIEELQSEENSSDLEDEWQEFFPQTLSPIKTQAKQFAENQLTATHSLYGQLMQQVNGIFTNDLERKAAEILIGNIDTHGYMRLHLKEVATVHNLPLKLLKPILSTIQQQFDPPGIGAQNLQECLLLQLSRHQEEKSLSYTIVKQHFSNLLQNEIPTIAKALKVSIDEVYKTINGSLAKLSFHPGTKLTENSTQILIPDLSIKEEQGTLTTSVNEAPLIAFRLNAKYKKLLSQEDIDKETADYIREKIHKAKWLFRNLTQRRSTLTRLANVLIEKQKEFFLHPQGTLKPMTMKEVATALDVHESTITRAVANKYLLTERGILPLRLFFSGGYATTKGKKVSSSSVKEKIKKLIDEEDKNHPLTDQEISNHLLNEGIQCARRTIGKYRSSLGLASAKQRKIHKKQTPS